MATKSIFDTPVTDLKLRDYAKEIPAVPKAAAIRPPSGGNAVSNVLRLANQQRQVQKLAGKAARAQAQIQPWNPAAIQGYENLPYSEQSRLYEENIKTNVAALKEAHTDANELALEEALRSRTPGPVAPTRSWGEAIGDTGRGIVAGGAGLVGSAAAFFDPASETAQTLSRFADEQRKAMSAVEQDVQRQIAFETQRLYEDPERSALGRFFGEMGIQWRNLSVGQVAELAGNIVPTLVLSGGAGLAAGGAARLGGAAAGTAARIGGRAATATGVGAAPVLSGGDAAQSAYERIMATPFEELSLTDAYQRIIADGTNPDEARQKLALQAASTARAVGAGVGLATAALPGSLERSVGRAVSGRAVAGGVGRVVGRRVGEAALEGGEEAGTTIAGNFGAAQIDPSVNLAEGAGQGALLGALGGAGAGAGVGAFGRRRARNMGSEGETPSTAPVSEPEVPGLSTEPEGDSAVPAAPAGTSMSVGGATLVVGPDGLMGYGEGQTPNPAADAMIASFNADALAGEPSPTVEPPLTEPTAEPSPVVEPPLTEPTAEPSPVVEPPLTEPTAEPAAGPVTPAGQDINTARFTEALNGASPEVVSSLNALDSRLAPLLSQIQTDTNAAMAHAQARAIIYQAAQQSQKVASALRRATSRIGEGVDINTTTPLAYFAGQVGLGQRIAHNQNPWAKAVRQANSGTEVLSTLSSDPSAGLFNNQAAKQLLDIYQQAHVPVPYVVYRGVSTGRRTGSYDINKHAVELASNSHAATINHEFLHGLTSRALYRMETSVLADGNQEAADTIALMRDLHSQMRQAAEQAGDQGSFYPVDPRRDSGFSNHEMLADLMRPEWLTLAAQTPVGSLSEAGQRAAQRLGLTENNSLLDMVTRMLRNLVNTLGGNLTDNSVAEMLGAVIADTIPDVRRSLGVTAIPQGSTKDLTQGGATSTPAFQRWFGGSRVVDALGNPLVVYHGTGSDITVFDPSRTQLADGVFVTPDAAYASTFAESAEGNPNVIPLYAKIERPRYINANDFNTGTFQAAVTDGASDGVIVLNPDGSIHSAFVHEPNQLKSATGNAGTFDPLSSSIVESREPFPGVTLNELSRGESLQQGAENIEGETGTELESPRQSVQQLISGITAGQSAPATSPSRAVAQAAARKDWTGVRQALAGTADFLNERLHDHLSPVKRWMQSLPVADRLKDSLIGSLYRAAPVRDATLRNGMERYGGREVQRSLAQIVDKYNMSAETAMRDVGFWITAQYAPAANQKLIDRDTSSLMQAQAAVQADPTPENQQAFTAAADRLARRVRAVNNPNPNTRKHAAGVGGFSNAAARAVANAVEQRIDRADLDRVAQQLYDFNAWVLALDIESGKASPAVVASFLNRPDLEAELTTLRDMSARADAESEAGTAALEAQRDLVIQSVRGLYVPLTGNPDLALTQDLFQTDSRAPNVGGDYALEGRTSSIPDDGITASFARALKSSNYMGWRDFQDNIANAYHSMSDAQRQEAGIAGRPLDSSGTQIGENAIIRRRGNSTWAYTFADNRFIPAIRGANVDDTSGMMRFLGTPTKWFSYMATQLNPFFAPRNYIRDTWERTELLRTREYRNEQGDVIDSAAAARAALSYNFNPSKAPRLIRSSWRAAWNKTDDTREGRYLREMLAAGGGSVWGDRFASDRKKFVDGIMRERGLRKNLRPVAEWVDAANRAFDMSPALSTYMALREQGVPVDQAAAGSLDLMNFRKRGSAMPLFNALYAFAQPAVTGGVNAFSSIYTPQRGWNRVGLTRLIGFTLTLGALQALARSLADDDEGGNKLDQLGDFVLDNNIALPVGDGVLKIPLAFGTARLANGMARSFISTATNNQTPGDAFGSFVSGSLVPVISPIEDVNIDWTARPTQAFLMTFAPNWMKPAVSVAVNRTADDRPVVFDNYEKTDEYRSAQFGKNIPELYGDVARFMRQHFSMDMAPEEVRTLMRGVPLAPLTMALNGWVENPYRESKGRPVDNAIVRNVYSGYNQYARVGQFYRGLEETQEEVRKYTAGEKLTDEERKLVAWRQSWDEVDKKHRAAKSKITKDRTLSEATKEQRQRALEVQREQNMILYLNRLRQIKGKPTIRVPRDAVRVN